MFWTSLGALIKRCVHVSNSQEDYVHSKNIAKAMVARPHHGFRQYPLQRESDKYKLNDFLPSSFP